MWRFLAFFLLLGRLHAQSVEMTDTISLCTGDTLRGVVFGRDSILITDTLPNGTFQGVSVRVKPVYLDIRDTTLRWGDYFLGERRYANINVNQFGQTYLGCDSNITWVLFFGQTPYTPSADNYRWTAQVQPNIVQEQPVRIVLKPQSIEQLTSARVRLSLSDTWGRYRQLDVPDELIDWAITPQGHAFFDLPAHQLQAGWNYLGLEIGRQSFGFAILRIN